MTLPTLWLLCGRLVFSPQTGAYYERVFEAAATMPVSAACRLQDERAIREHGDWVCAVYRNAARDRGQRFRCEKAWKRAYT